MDCLSEVPDVASGDTGDRDTSVTGTVHAELLCETVNLLGLEASVAEHANLFFFVRFTNFALYIAR